MFWYLFLLQNTCIWLQWLGFGGKHSIFLCQRLQLPGPHKEFACFPIIPHLKSCQINVFYKQYVIFWGNLPIFHTKVAFFGATLLRVFGEILLISPQKSLYYCCVPLNHCIKLKFYAFCVFALANYVFCGIFIPKCQIPCYM